MMNRLIYENYLLLVLTGFFLFVSVLLFFTAKRQRKESQKLKLQLEEKKAQQDSTTLSDRLTHEISNPLSVIDDAVKELLKQTKDEVIKQDLASIFISTKRIEKIIQNAKDYIGSQNDTNPQLINLGELIDDVLRFQEERLDAKEIDIHLNHLDEVYVEGRRADLEELLVSLIRTSSENVESLSEKWIEISALPYDDHVRMTFRDSGHGISRKLLRKKLKATQAFQNMGKIHFEKYPHTKITFDL